MLKRRWTPSIQVSDEAKVVGLALAGLLVAGASRAASLGPLLEARRLPLKIEDLSPSVWLSQVALFLATVLVAYETVLKGGRLALLAIAILGPTICAIQGQGLLSAMMKAGSGFAEPLMTMFLLWSESVSTLCWVCLAATVANHVARGLNSQKARR